MSLFSNWFTKKEKVECPRCLGKGIVDWDDIKRLNRYLKWIPGSCAYCSSTGQVPYTRVEKVPVDTSYLSTELPGNEVKRLFRGDAGALERAKKYDGETDEFIAQIKRFHTVEGWNTRQICQHYFRCVPVLSVMIFTKINWPTMSQELLKANII